MCMSVCARVQEVLVIMESVCFGYVIMSAVQFQCALIRLS